jgi:hypothetical protein
MNELDTYRLAVYVHLLLAIVLMGMGLFWLIMQVALREKFPAAEAARWLETARQARWPHVGVPHSLRLPLPLISWALLIGLVGSGVVIGGVHAAPSGLLWHVKIVLVAALAVAIGLLGRRVTPLAVHAVFWLALATIVVSGLVIRG